VFCAWLKPASAGTNASRSDAVWFGLVTESEQATPAAAAVVASTRRKGRFMFVSPV
jgi:hypothetical protein